MNSRVKNVLITGGTRGLGLAYARFLASKGYDIGITDISESACRVYGEANSVGEILHYLEQFGVRAWFKAADLTKQAEVDQLVSAYLSRFGCIDSVVTNAGGDVKGIDRQAAGGKPQNNTFFISPDDAQTVFSRNFDSCVNTLRPILPIMVEQGFGKIVTVSSINAAFGVERETTYSVAKAAILQLTRSLATQFRSEGINVNCIMPGPVKTGRFLATLQDRSEHDRKNLEANGRLERVAEPHDIASVVEFLLSPAADFISGEVLKVDGGLFNHSI